jgi:hypothetical protein
MRQVEGSWVAPCPASVSAGAMCGIRRRGVLREEGRLIGSAGDVMTASAVHSTRIIYSISLHPLCDLIS